MSDKEMTEKELFISEMKKKTKQFAIDIIKFCDSLKSCKASSVITYYLLNQLHQLGQIIEQHAEQDRKMNSLVKFA